MEKDKKYQEFSDTMFNRYDTDLWPIINAMVWLHQCYGLLYIVVDFS